MSIGIWNLRQPPLLNQNFLDCYQNTFCVDSLCDATGICLFCYERGIHLFLQNNSYFCVFKYETKGQTKGLERGWKQRGRLGRDATTGRQYYFSCLTRPTTLTPRFTDFFTDFEKKKPDCVAVYFTSFSASNSVVKRNKGYTLVIALLNMFLFSRVRLRSAQ